MKKHWTELSNSPHYVYKMRDAFMREHKKADQIIVSKEGIPLQAIYFSPEMPSYGKQYTEEKLGLVNPEMKDVNGTP